MEFFYFLNFQHPNKKFTFEKQKDGKLLFLDILVSYTDTLLLVFFIKLHNRFIHKFSVCYPFTYKI